jgi:hypothetical protein
LSAGACSNLNGDSDTPILIQVSPPAQSGISGQVEIGDTAAMTAVAINQAGDTVPVTFKWRAVDTGLVAIDSVTGAVTGKVAGIARVQARTGSLISDLISLTVVPFADSLLIIPPDSARLLTTDTASAALVAEIDTINPSGPLTGRRLIYEIVQSFGQPGDSASLNGGFNAVGATTTSTGQPTTPVYVRKIPGVAYPDSVFVAVSSIRPSGASVPGSGQIFIIRFD